MNKKENLQITKFKEIDKKEFLKILKEFESVDINIKETIKNAYSFIFKGKIAAIEGDDIIKYDRISDNDVYNDINNALNNDGIYIPLVTMSAYHSEYVDKCDECEDSICDECEYYSIYEDEVEYEGSVTYTVESINGKESFYVDFDMPFMGHNSFGEYGIKVSKNEDGSKKVEFVNKFVFGHRCSHIIYIGFIGEKATDSWGYPDAVANQLVVDVIKNLIVFN